MEQIVNKLLGMTAETRRRSIEAAVLYIFMVFATFNLPVPGEQWTELIVKLLGVLLEGFILFYEEHYKNNDHTEIAAEHTGEMYQEKLEQEPGYEGERFYTEDPNGVNIDDLEECVDDEAGDDDEEEGVEIDE